jgi:hypothetical protein
VKTIGTALLEQLGFIHAKNALRLADRYPSGGDLSRHLQRLRWRSARKAAAKAGAEPAVSGCNPYRRQFLVYRQD